MRGVARDAGVDTRLVTHYFGSKQDLFIAVVELPFDPDVVMAAVLEPGPGGSATASRPSPWACSRRPPPGGR